jgi:hypothetical protein
MGGFSLLAHGLFFATDLSPKGEEMKSLLSAEKATQKVDKRKSPRA